MNSQLGIILDNLLPSQANYYAQRNAHKAIENGIFKDVTLFYIEKSSMMNQPRLSTCHVNQLCGFEGDVIATSITSAIKLLKVPIMGRKYYYLLDMEWLHGGVVDVNQLYRIYRQENLIYIARCDLHAKLMSNNFNMRPSIIMDNFDFEKFYDKI